MPAQSVPWFEKRYFAPWARIAVFVSRVKGGQRLVPAKANMPVSLTNSKVIFDALKKCDIRMLSALPETWLVHLIRMADDDPDMILLRLAKD